MGSVSGALKYLKEGLNPMSKMQLGYRASKSALNMGEELFSVLSSTCAHPDWAARPRLPTIFSPEIRVRKLNVSITAIAHAARAWEVLLPARPADIVKHLR
jgi:hypothetical protein